MDAIIDILLGLLVVAVPVVFRWIGKAFDKAGQRSARQDDGLSEAERVFQQWQETLARSVETEPAESTGPVKQAGSAEPVKPAVEKRITQMKPSVSAGKTVKIVLEESPKAEKEKIDPKKLIVYSEIMKPKYTE